MHCCCGPTHSERLSVSAGLHHVLQAEYVQVYSAPLGQNAGLLHRVRHSHTENVQVGWHFGLNKKHISDLSEKRGQKCWWSLESPWAAFSCDAAGRCNQLPDHLNASQHTATFKSRLKIKDFAMCNIKFLYYIKLCCLF